MEHYIQLKDIGKASHYDILGVSPNSNQQVIKKAYQRKLLSNHPDKSHDAAVSVIDIKEAYRVLLDSKLRQGYDRTLEESMKKHGFNISGRGLDIYYLDEFEMQEKDQTFRWSRHCPRCESPNSINLFEDDLEYSGTSDGEGGYDIIVQCDSCSLWIQVKYYESNDNESGNEIATRET